MTSSAITRILLANTGFERTDFSTGWGEDFPNHPVFWNFSSDNNKKELVWETGRGEFLKPTLFQCFQGWNAQKGVGLRNLSPEVSSNFPIPGAFCSKNFSFEFGCCVLTGWVLVLASGYRVRIPLKPDFSNLPFFTVFRAETLKKGYVWEILPRSSVKLLHSRWSLFKKAAFNLSLCAVA